MALSRRDFTAWLGGAAFGAALPGYCAIGASDAYSVSVLGDMHYDAFPPEKFHAAALKKWLPKKAHPARLKEFKRNAAMWQDVCKRILDASSKCVRGDAAFALQLGDLVQGDCESDELHRQMLKEATDLLVKAYPGLPVVSVCGNHDIREGDNDTGATKAYADYMVPFESRQLAKFAPKGFKSTTFGFRRGPDLWIALDFTYGKRDAEIVRKLLANNRNVRYTFITTHGPVLPMDYWRSRWFYLGWPHNAELRREMRALFARRNAIVLAGHVHTLEYKDWYGDGGRITEMVLNTCAGLSKGGYNPADPEVFRTDPKNYGDWAGEKDGMKDLFAEYRDGLRSYYAAHAVGHHILRVSDESVELDYYGHDRTVPTKTFVLRKHA